MPMPSVQVIKETRNVTPVFVRMASKEMVLFVEVIESIRVPIITKPLYRSFLLYFTCVDAKLSWNGEQFNGPFLAHRVAGISLYYNCNSPY